MTTKKVKVAIYLPTDLNELLEQECERLAVTKTGYITEMVRNQLDIQRKLMESMTPDTLKELIESALKGSKQ